MPHPILNPDELEWLRHHAGNLATEAAKRHGVERADVLNWKKKRCPVVMAREDVVQGVLESTAYRIRYWGIEVRVGRRVIRRPLRGLVQAFDLDVYPPPAQRLRRDTGVPRDTWLQLSHPMLSKVLGGEQSSFSLILSRAKRRDAQFAEDSLAPLTV